jgi:hypothetical protein
VDVPVTWAGVLKGTDSEVGSNWSSFGGVSIGSSITATSDLYAWHNTAEAPGLYAVASRSLAQRYSDDELVAMGPNDFASSCAAGVRGDYNRPPYSGKMQQWDCGEGHSTLTLAATPEDRECMVLLQVAMFEEADRSVGQSILDSFKADCVRVVESATQEASGASASTSLRRTSLVSLRRHPHASTAARIPETRPSRSPRHRRRRHVSSPAASSRTPPACLMLCRPTSEHEVRQGAQQ